jgi:maltokinase
MAELPSPTPEQVAGARWYGGKPRPVAELAELDRLDLGAGWLSVLKVTPQGGRPQRYLWIDGPVGEPLLRRLEAGGREGRFAFRPGHGLGELLPVSGERPIGHDQSNTSLVVGERAVVKLYRRLEPGAHPEVELGAHLTGIGFDGVPAFAGEVDWDGHLLALVQAYIPDAVEGWTWAADLVLAGEVGDIARAGGLVSGMHAALARLGARPATADQLAAWRAGAQDQLERAIGGASAEGRELLEAERPAIERGLDGLLDAQAPVVQRVHGDLHIGQLLRAGGRLVVVDLEGEPSRPLAERSAPGLVLRDVAAMLRSFDHLARHVQRERAPQLDVEPWIQSARAAFLDAYGPVDPGLLRALEVEKECYEFTYAAGYLPEWEYVAAGGMRWLVERMG